MTSKIQTETTLSNCNDTPIALEILGNELVQSSKISIRSCWELLEFGRSRGMAADCSIQPFNSKRSGKQVKD
jgi:hypothetical protein